MEELLDLVNENDEVIGTVTRSEAHSDPSLIHREVGVALFSPGMTHVLLQKRSQNKKINPGKWVLSVTGHVDAGEEPGDAAIREMKEELAIEIKIRFVYKELIRKPDKESRFVYFFVGECEMSKVLNFDMREIEKVDWVKIEDLETFGTDDESFSVNSASYRVIERILEQS